MSNNTNDKNKASGCLTIPFILLCVFFGGKEGYNQINNNEPVNTEYQTQYYTQQYQQDNNEYEERILNQRSKSLHEFNRDLKSGKSNNQTLELRPDEIQNQPDPETLELKPENFY